MFYRLSLKALAGLAAILLTLASCEQPLVPKAVEETLSTGAPAGSFEDFLKSNSIVAIEGGYLWDEDILISEDQVQSAYAQFVKQANSRGNLSTYREYTLWWYDEYLNRWSDADKLNLTYRFETDLSLVETIPGTNNRSDAIVRDAFRQAARMWMDAANVNFIESGSDDVKLKVYRGWADTRAAGWATYPYNASHIGSMNGYVERSSGASNVTINGREMNFFPGNYNFDQIRSVFLHEIGHALGLAHEHQRTDSTDTYGQGAYGVAFGALDGESIMHYDSDDSNQLSNGDVASVQYLYGASGLTYSYYHADINGDNRVDLIKVSDQTHDGWIGLGQPDGSIQHWSNHSTMRGATSIHEHYFADINGDGRDDWIQVSKNTNIGWIGLGQADGNVQHWTNDSSHRGATSSFTHYFADINGDGRADWIQVSKTDNIGWIGLGQPDGSIQHWTNSSTHRGATNNFTHYFADINGDGRADWIQVYNFGNGGWIGLGQADGSIQHWSNYSAHRGAANNYSHYFADINGDGRQDWIQVAKTTNNGYIALGQADGNADLEHYNNWSYHRGATDNFDHYFADMNGDGRDDWIQVSKTDNGGWIGLGQLDGSIVHWSNSSSHRGAANQFKHLIGDINGDGKADWTQVFKGYPFGWTGLGQADGNVNHWNFQFQ